MAEYDGPGEHERAFPEQEHDAREEMREAIRRRLWESDTTRDPGQIGDFADAVVRALAETTSVGHTGWLVLAGLGHVYSVESAQMTDASKPDHSRWTIRTRNDLDATGRPAADDFFRAGAEYVDGSPWKAPEETRVFRCTAVSTHPDTGEQVAFGWIRTTAPWAMWSGTGLGPPHWLGTGWSRTEGVQ